MAMRLLLLLSFLISSLNADCVANNKTYQEDNIYEADIMSDEILSNGKRYPMDRIRFKCIKTTDGSLMPVPIACLESHWANIKTTLKTGEMHREDRYEYYCVLTRRFTGLLRSACLTNDGKRFTAGETAQDDKYEYKCKAYGFFDYPSNVVRYPTRCVTRKGTLFGPGQRPTEDGLAYQCIHVGMEEFELRVKDAE